MNQFQKMLVWIFFSLLLFIWSAAEIFFHIRNFFEKQGQG